jgi:signal transduction histidine kinase
MRRELVLMTLAVTSIVVIAFVVPLAWLVHTIAADRAVSRASTDAQYVGQLIAGDRAGAPASVAQFDAVSPGRISVYYADGSVVGDRSRPPDAPSLLVARRGRAFHRAWSGGVDVFVPVLEAGGRTAVVRVAISRVELDRGVRVAWWSLAALGLALVGVAALVADRMARSITRPIQALTEVAERLAGGDLGARFEVGGPHEVVAVGRALDALALRIGDLLRAEREHAADLSHSLRTPLTALRLDAELIGDDTDARRITAAIDDLENAVTNVIADTRRERAHDDRSGVDLSEVVRERLSFWGVLVRAQDRTFEVRATRASLQVNARRRELEEVVDVLLGNVLRHTAPGAAVRVAIEPRPGGGGRLVVEDAGSGFEARDSVSTAGSGRGLDIARRIANAAGGAVLRGRSDLGGARVAVELGAPAHRVH